MQSKKKNHVIYSHYFAEDASDLMDEGVTNVKTTGQKVQALNHQNNAVTTWLPYLPTVPILTQEKGWKKRVIWPCVPIFAKICL